MNSQQLQLLHRLVLSEVERTNCNVKLGVQGALVEHNLTSATLVELTKTIEQQDNKTQSTLVNVPNT